MVENGRAPVRRSDLRRWDCSSRGVQEKAPTGLLGGSGEAPWWKDWSLPGAGSVAGDEQYSWQREQRVQRHSDERARLNTPKLGTMAGAAGWGPGSTLWKLS